MLSMLLTVAISQIPDLYWVAMVERVSPVTTVWFVELVEPQTAAPVQWYVSTRSLWIV